MVGNQNAIFPTNTGKPVQFENTHDSNHTHMFSWVSVCILVVFVLGSLGMAVHAMNMNRMRYRDTLYFASVAMAYEHTTYHKDGNGALVKKSTPRYKTKNLEYIRSDISDRNLIETWWHGGKDVSITVKTRHPITKTSDWVLSSASSKQQGGNHPLGIVRVKGSDDVYRMDFGTMPTSWGHTKLSTLTYRTGNPDKDTICILQDWEDFLINVGQ